ncbi:MAG: alpha/beta hydrolase [Spirochaetaceae bacterium]|jgi:pimeloyl-ACP methyl ester carboxylesterase|nr:alpha/beta hydrolase [Spirochaetaceae bacterium]
MSSSLFRPWPALAAQGKLLPSSRFPGLFYYDSGPVRSDRPALVLVHGLGDEADTWRHLIPILNSAGWRTVAPDLPGFGRSPGGRRRTGLGAHTAAVLELAEIACSSGNSRNAVFIGSSMGAYIAEAAALKRPDPSGALILIDGCIPAGAAVPPGLLAMALPFSGKKWYRAFRTDPEKAWQSLFPFYADLEKLSPDDKKFLSKRVLERVQSLKQERAYFSSLRSMILHQMFRLSWYTRKIKTWPGSIRLIWGESDLVVPRSRADFFLSLRPGQSRDDLAVIPGAGHLPHQEKPAETAEAVLAFLRR